VTNIDGDTEGWRFVELGKLSFVVFTSPSDERLLTNATEMLKGSVKVRPKFCGEAEVVQRTAHRDGRAVTTKGIDRSPTPHEGFYFLKVSVKNAHGTIVTDEIGVESGDSCKREQAECDRDKALQAWPEHGLLGTQPGPNKAGKK
jgi:Icc protein